MTKLEGKLAKKRNAKGNRPVMMVMPTVSEDPISQTSVGDPENRLSVNYIRSELRPL